MNDDSFPNEHEFPDELISAYLDGELTDDEKQRVEEQLMDSAEHRRLFDELKALRSSLQTLPRQALDEDFAQRVLRRAERQLLTGDDAKQYGAAPQPSPRRNSMATTAERGSWRGLVWSVTAMAAAVALIVFSPLLSERTPNHVAVNEADSREEDSASRETEAGRPLTTTAENLANARHDQIGQAIQDGSGTTSQRATDGVAADANRDGWEAAKAEKGFDNGRNELKKSDAFRQLAQGESADRRSNAPHAAGHLEGSGGLGGDTPQVNAATAVDALANKYAASTQHAAPPSNGFVLPSGERMFARTETANIAAEKLQQLEDARTAGLASTADFQDGVLIVSVNMTPDALAGHFMDEMLKKHEIHVELAQADVAAKSGRALGGREAAREASSQNFADSAADVKGRDEAVAAEESHLQPRARASHGKDTELMYVVASAEQVDRLLDDLRRQPAEVLSLAYDHPAADRQTGFADDGAQLRRGRTFRNVAPDAQALGDEDRGKELHKRKQADGELKAADLAAKPQALSTQSRDDAGDDPESGQREAGADKTLTGAKNEATTPGQSQGGQSAGSAQAGIRDATGGDERPLEFQSRGGQPNAAELDGILGEGSALGKANENDAAERDAYRGIARRLRLPEDWGAYGNRPAGPAGASAAKLAEDRIAAPAHAAGENGGRTAEMKPLAANQSGGGAAVDSPNADRLQLQREARRQGEKQTTIRVLFVLRAVAPPDSPVVPARIPAEAAASQQPADE